MNKKLVVFVCLVLVCSLVLPTAAVVGKKPPKPPDDPPTAPGTIFFTYPGWVCTVQGDGSQLTYLTEDAPGVGRLSNLKHGGHYWYIDFELVDGAYPDGLQRREIVAVRDDNTMTIQLTNDGTLATSTYSSRPTWGPNDGFISWIAKKWVLGDSGWVISEAGIYKQAVSYDSDGNIDGMLGTPSNIWDLTLSQKPDGKMYPDSNGHYWSPDGTKFVHKTSGLYIVDLATQSETYLTDGHDEEWSPDGTRIAFAYLGNVKTINVDGTGETIIKALKPGKGRQPDTGYGAPSWSPDSDYITFYSAQSWMKHGNHYSNTDIHFINLETGEEACLTDGLEESKFKKVKAWR
jgi:hypothetical protein